jgi:stage V sporulation protein SpoVS
LTDNQLLVVKGCDPAALAPAIIARICTRGHTVLECYGAAAAQQAVLVGVTARRQLLFELCVCLHVL